MTRTDYSKRRKVALVIITFILRHEMKDRNLVVEPHPSWAGVVVIFVAAMVYHFDKAHWKSKLAG